MHNVGEFPGMLEARRRTVRQPTNPLDKSTIISIYPRAIAERKHTIQPGFFQIEPGSPDKPSILIVGSSSWWREIDEEQPLLEIVCGSVQVADAIVRDYCSGMLGADANNNPGLFWTPGEYTIESLRKEKPQLFSKAIERQNNYWTTLVRMADSLWARTDGNPLVISDDMRLAAKALNLNNKDWMQDFKTAEMINCSACGSLRNPKYPVCPNCKNIVDPAKATALGLKFAE